MLTSVAARGWRVDRDEIRLGHCTETRAMTGGSALLSVHVSRNRAGGPGPDHNRPSLPHCLWRGAVM